jgi:hypothetical protein
VICFLDNLDKQAEISKEIEMNSPECDLKGHGPCSGPICQRGMSLNHRCDAHVRLQSYWTQRNPGKKLIDWLDGLQNMEREEVLRKASPRGKYWQEVSVESAEE